MRSESFLGGCTVSKNPLLSTKPDFTSDHSCFDERPLMSQPLANKAEFCFASSRNLRRMIKWPAGAVRERHSSGIFSLVDIGAFPPVAIELAERPRPRTARSSPIIRIYCKVCCSEKVILRVCQTRPSYFNY